MYGYVGINTLILFSSSSFKPIQLPYSAIRKEIM